MDREENRVRVQPPSHTRVLPASTAADTVESGVNVAPSPPPPPPPPPRRMTTPPGYQHEYQPPIFPRAGSSRPSPWTNAATWRYPWNNEHRWVTPAATTPPLPPSPPSPQPYLPPPAPPPHQEQETPPSFAEVMQTGVRTTRVWVLRDIPYKTILDVQEQQAYVKQPDAHRNSLNAYIPISHTLTSAEQSRVYDRILSFVDEQKQRPARALGLYVSPSRRPSPVEPDHFLDEKRGENKQQQPPQQQPQQCPILIFVHGGGWRSGHRASSNVHDMLITLCKLTGSICISIGYRLCQSVSRTFDMVIGGMALLSMICFHYTPSDQWGQRIIWLMLALLLLVMLCVLQYLHKLTPNRHPTAVADIADGIQWVSQHAHEMDGDAHRITLMGHSAGAHLITTLYASAEYWEWTRIPRFTIVGIVAISGVYSAKYMSNDLMFRGIGRLVFGNNEAVWEDYFPSQLNERYRRYLTWPAVLLLSAEFDYGLRDHAREFYESLSRSTCTKLDWLTVRDVNHFSVCHFWEWQHHRIPEYIVTFLHTTGCL